MGDKMAAFAKCNVAGSHILDSLGFLQKYTFIVIKINKALLFSEFSELPYVRKTFHE